jgi:hypothetical protein
MFRLKLNTHGLSWLIISWHFTFNAVFEKNCDLRDMENKEVAVCAKKLIVDPYLSFFKNIYLPYILIELMF